MSDANFPGCSLKPVLPPCALWMAPPGGAARKHALVLKRLQFGLRCVLRHCKGMVGGFPLCFGRCKKSGYLLPLCPQNLLPPPQHSFQNKYYKLGTIFHFLYILEFSSDFSKSKYNDPTLPLVNFPRVDHLKELL